MKKTVLQEINAMNKIAGTQMTTEQEIALIKQRLQELEFGTQKAFDTYKKNHDMRPDTKVKVAGKNTTVAQASKSGGNGKSKGTSVFATNKKKADNEFKGKYNLKDVGNDISTDIDTKLAHGRELKSRLDKGEEGAYHQKTETGGTIVFKSDGKKYNIVDDGDGIKVDIVPNAAQKQYQKYVDSAFNDMMTKQFGKDWKKQK